MNFAAFWRALQELEESIAITSPVAVQVKRAYWGAPVGQTLDLPCIINTLAEPERSLTLGSRDQRLRISVQLMAARATVEDEQSSLIATELWFASLRAFDRNRRLGGLVAWSLLRGADPTVPVLLQHAGQAYIGFDGSLEIRDIESIM